MPNARYAVSIDVGGTFTDFVLFDLAAGAPTAFHKVLTTPREPARAVVSGWRELLGAAGVASAQIDHAVHGTTLVTNAIIERRGARTALITTRGFRDVLEIGIEQTYDIYDLFAPFPTPLIPRRFRREIHERLTRDGAVVEPLDEAEVRTLVDELAAEGIQSIAVALIHAYRDPAHERRIAQLVAETHPAITVSLSSQVAPLIGEYERTSTTAADAYVKPVVQRYLADLLDRLRELGFRRQLYLMLSSGGIALAETAMAFPIRLLESGPAAGAFGAGFYGRHLTPPADAVLSLDMGGTTAKSCLVERGVPSVTHMLEADRRHRFKPGSGLPIMTPTIDLIEIGAGGGSIAHVNDLGLLNVGPQSAGSDPGPACYGLGGELPTVTDANLLLGYLDPGYFLGGRLALDPKLAERAIARQIGAPLRLSPLEAAWGIHTIVNENMARATRNHAIERNRDPRDLTLVAFGGAGPAHAAAVARILGIARVVVPLGAGVLSAIGALVAPLALPFVRSYITPLPDCDWELVRGLYAEMAAEARRALRVADDAAIRLGIAADMRYVGQYHEIRVDLPTLSEWPPRPEQIEARFRVRYANAYDRTLAGLPIEILNWHLVAELPDREFRLTPAPAAAAVQGAALAATALKGERPVASGTEVRPVPVYDRYRLAAGATLAGPCIVEEREATIVVPPGDGAEVDAHRNVVIVLSGKGGRP